MGLYLKSLQNPFGTWNWVFPSRRWPKMDWICMRTLRLVSARSSDEVELDCATSSSLSEFWKEHREKWKWNKMSQNIHNENAGNQPLWSYKLSIKYVFMKWNEGWNYSCLQLQFPDNNNLGKKNSKNFFCFISVCILFHFGLKKLVTNFTTWNSLINFRRKMPLHSPPHGTSTS